MECEKRNIEICGSFSGKITTSIQYENRDAFFSVKEVLENCDITDEEIKMRQKMLNDMCYQNYNEKIDEIKGVVRVPNGTIVTDTIVDDSIPRNERDKAAEFRAMITHADSEEAMREVGKQIAQKKNSFHAMTMGELRSRFNDKMKEIKNGK